MDVGVGCGGGGGGLIQVLLWWNLRNRVVINIIWWPSAPALSGRKNLFLFAFRVFMRIDILVAILILIVDRLFGLFCFFGFNWSFIPSAWVNSIILLLHMLLWLLLRQAILVAD